MFYSGKQCLRFIKHFQDYSSPSLDLRKSDTFRDLSRPMVPQTDDRRARFRQRCALSVAAADDDIKFTKKISIALKIQFCLYLLQHQDYSAFYLKLRKSDTLSDLWRN